jgi:2-polyprenyl-6-methoxyphenol hydroxylase-like FAD-dependent oxidoreductase
VTTIAVIGGGIGGLAVSIALRNVGLTTEVFERQRHFSERGVALILTPNGVKALDALGRGVGAAVRELGHRLPRGVGQPFITPDGRRFVATPSADLEERFGAPLVTIRRTNLLRALLDAHGEVGLRAGWDLIELRDETETVRALFDQGRELQAAVMVGADGLGSTVRRHLFGGAPPQYLGFVSIRGITRDVALPPDLAEGFNFSGPGVGMHCSAVGRGELYWSAGVRTDSWPETAVEARAVLLRLLAAWGAPATDLVGAADVETMVITPITSRPPLPSWRRGRVTLLGDAAHPMAPFLGQGANTTLEDAVVLANCLGSRADVVEALIAYERARIDRTSRITKVSEVVATGAGGGGGRGDFVDFMDWLYGYAPDTQGKPAELIDRTDPSV